jgi:hypothetical protein
MRTIALLLIGLTFLASCGKNETRESKTEEQIITTAHGPTLHLDGTIQWGGDPAADGAGWTFIAAETNKRYQLKGLSQTFQVDDLKVAISLKETTEKAPCFCPDPPFLFAVVAIEKK